MNVKLTLRLDEEAVEKGKQFAASHGTSLSQLVQSYFIMLDEPDVDEIPISRKLQSLIGMGAGDYDEDDYREHVLKKN